MFKNFSQAAASRFLAAALLLVVVFPANAQDDSPKPLKLTVLPFFSSELPMQPKSLETLHKWALDAVEKGTKEDHPHISLDVAERDELGEDLLGKLPQSRPGEVSELLSSVCGQRGTDGALAFWIEAGADKSFRVGSLLYLPKRLEFQSFTVSANIERATLPVGDKGKFEKATTKDVVTELLSRNVGRIQEPEPEALAVDDGGSTPGAEDGGTAPETDDGGVPVPGVEDDSENEEGVLAPESDGVPPPKGKFRLGVFEFSRDFIQPGDRIQQTFSRAAMEMDFRTAVTTLLNSRKGGVVHAVKLPGSPVSYDQIETPVLTLDPNADPKAKEKYLLKQVPNDIDGLVFGHLHEAQQGKKSELVLYLRVLMRDDLEIATEKLPWPIGPGEKKKNPSAYVTTALAPKADSFFGRVFGVVPDFIQIKIPADATLSKFARCYFTKQGKAAPEGRIIDVLSNYNAIINKDDIKAGYNFKLPLSIDGNFGLKRQCKWISKG